MALLSREEVDGFLTWPGNFSRETLLSLRNGLWETRMKIQKTDAHNAHLSCMTRESRDAGLRAENGSKTP
jgi:hypothetical protein